MVINFLENINEVTDCKKYEMLNFHQKTRQGSEKNGAAVGI